MSCWGPLGYIGVQSCPFPATCISHSRPEFKRMQIQQKLKKTNLISSSLKHSAGISSNWLKKNMTIINDLAYKLNISVIDISDLLFNLTFQNYAKILNPIGSGWNTFRVPFSIPDIGDRYLNIFDLEGNLRNPTDPKSLFILLKFLQSIVKSERYVKFPLREYIESTRTPLDINYEYNTRLRRLVDKTEIDVEDSNSENIENDMDNVTNVSHHRMQNFKYMMKGDRKKLRREDLLLNDPAGRRRAHGSRQLNELRTNALSQLLKKIEKGDPEKFMAALAACILPDLGKSKKKQKEKKPKEISETINYTTISEDYERLPSNISRFSINNHQLSISLR